MEDNSQQNLKITMERNFQENSDTSISHTLRWEAMRVVVRAVFCVKYINILKRKQINDMEAEICRLTEIHKRSGSPLDKTILQQKTEELNLLDINRTTLKLWCLVGWLLFWFLAHPSLYAKQRY